MISIVVMMNGFVSVGRVTGTDKYLLIDDANVVRRWGTTRGLGQIAKDGPTANTALDPTPRERVPLDKVIKIIECDQGAWEGKLR